MCWLRTQCLAALQQLVQACMCLGVHQELMQAWLCHLPVMPDVSLLIVSLDSAEL